LDCVRSIILINETALLQHGVFLLPLSLLLQLLLVSIYVQKDEVSCIVLSTLSQLTKQYNKLL
jgi:hypothetical protein